PLTFQQSKAVPRFIPEDHAKPVSQELANELVGILRAFLTEMNDYERRWLELRPIDQWGVDDVSELGNRNIGYSYCGPTPAERNANPLFWDPNATEDQKKEALEVGKHWKMAVAEKRKIWQRFLTLEERALENCFHQQVPPYYDPVALIDPEVREVVQGHVIISYGLARPPETCGGRVIWSC